MDEEEIKCYHTQLIDVTYKTCYELFHGFDTIKAITFSYDIGFIDMIMEQFSYGEIILGGSFLTQKDNKLQTTMADLYAHSFEAGKYIRKYKTLVNRVLNDELLFRTPISYLDHRKIYLLKNDMGHTRVITTSANMTKRAWNSSQIETYSYDDSMAAYEAYEEEFETAWDLSVEIEQSVLTSKKTDDLVDDNPFLESVKEKNRTIVLQQIPDDEYQYEITKYVIDHQNLQEEYQKLLRGTGSGSNGKSEITSEIYEKIKTNKRKLDREKVVFKEIERPFPDININYEEETVQINGKNADLSPSPEDVKHDISEILSIFDNYGEFFGDIEALRETQFKILNAIFASPFNAELRCVSRIASQQPSTKSLPMFMLISSESANSGKSFMVTASLKLMTGENLKPFNKAETNKKDIQRLQTSIKGTPVFIDEVDNKSFGFIKDLLKNPEICEEHRLDKMPMLILASNDILDPDETFRKRILFFRLNASLPSSIDQTAFESKSNALLGRLGTAFYRAYLARMIPIINKTINYILYREDDNSSYYPDHMKESSQVIRGILTDYGFETPDYMRELSWDQDYSINAKHIASDAIRDIERLYNQNRKLFKIEKDTITIELGTDKESQNKIKSWQHSLPTELRAEKMITRDKSQITLDRKELEKLLGHTLKKHSFFN